MALRLPIRKSPRVSSGLSLSRSRRAAPASRPARRTGKGGGSAAGAGAGGGGRPAAAPERRQPGNDAGVDRPVIVIDGGADGGGCTSSVTCTPPNGRYCGVIGNGCFGTLDCGACPSGEVCEVGVCVGGAELRAARLPAGAGKYCGSVGDGCGRAMDCGGCAGGADLQRLGPVRERRAACR